MKNLSMTVKLLGIAVVTSVLTLLVGLIGLYGLSRVTANVETITGDTMPTLIGLSDMKEGLLEVRRLEQSMLIPELNSSKEEITSRIKTLGEPLALISEGTKIFEAVAMDPEEKAGWAALMQNMKSWKQAHEQVLKLIMDGKREEAMKLSNDSRSFFRSSRDGLTKLIKHNVEQANATSKESLQEAKQGRTTMLSVLAACVVLSIILSLWVSRVCVVSLRQVVHFADKTSAGKLDEVLTLNQKDEIGHLADSLRAMVVSLKEKIGEAEDKSQHARVKSEEAEKATAMAEQALKQAESAKAEGMMHAADKLEEVVDVLSSASEELSAQIDLSTRGTDEQSQRVSETATAMEEMNATVLDVARNASQAADTSTNAREKAEEGAKIVGDVVAGIADVQILALDLKTNMTSLGKQAEGIGQILNVISDIADQTNLLALNAAIEAARAGEAGRGFAVVADEVRKLAEKTMTATKEVGDAIRGIQQGTQTNILGVEKTAEKIDQATDLANKSGEALREIVNLVEMATDQVRSIATASEQQSATSEEINRSVGDVDRISTETANAMRESALAVNELAKQALVLRSLIGELQSEGNETRDSRPELPA